MNMNGVNEVGRGKRCMRFTQDETWMCWVLRKLTLKTVVSRILGMKTKKVCRRAVREE